MKMARVVTVYVCTKAKHHRIVLFNRCIIPAAWKVESELQDQSLPGLQVSLGNLERPALKIKHKKRAKDVVQW